MDLSVMTLLHSPWVTFSHDIFSAQRNGGISRCMIELMRSLNDIDIQWRTWAGDHANELLTAFLTENCAADRVVQNTTKRLGSRLTVSLRNELAFKAWLRSQPSSILHRTYYPIVELAKPKLAHVETLHDMWDELSTVDQDRRAPMRSWLKRQALKRADLIVCVSKSTFNQAASIWPWVEKKSVIIPHGVRKLSANPIAAGRDRPYFLFVGKRGLYKNFSVILSAFSAAALTDHELICFGGGAPNDTELAAINDARLGNRVHFLSGSDARLAGLYEAATALLYPSSYEGFGLPLLEAMVHGCPVVTTPLTSLPEVAGPAALYAEADRQDAWVDALRRLGTDTAFCESLREAGYKQADKFSWESTAKAHVHAYKTLV